MFKGEFSANVGAKNRLAIPKKLRDEFRGEVYITRGYEGCLILVDGANWNRFINLINTESILREEIRNVKRYIIGGASEIEHDRQGRFVLSENLKEFAGIEEQVIFIGLDDWIEIWDSELWEAKLKNISKNINKTSKEIALLISNKSERNK